MRIQILAASLLLATALPASAGDCRLGGCAAGGPVGAIHHGYRYDPGRSYVVGRAAGVYDRHGFVYPADFGFGACGANPDCSYPVPQPRLPGVPAAGYAAVVYSYPYFDPGYRYAPTYPTW